MHRRTLPLLVAALLMLLAGCASGDDGGSDANSGGGTTTSSSAATASDQPSEDAAEVVEVTVAVSDGKVTPKPRRVDVPAGAQVRLQITSDVDDEVHVHGYDVEETLEAGRTTTVEFTADQTGLFEVETHESELELVQLEVR